MDKQVQRALIKWPNVPHCYGWLELDARGMWRIRDQRTHELGLLGSKITNVTLRNFIDRNYQADDVGRYFFQNGPQRVYVELQSTPYIAHSDPQRGWVLHTDITLKTCDAVWITAEGNFVLKSGDVVAQIDDRDTVDAMACVYLNGQQAGDEQIVNWLHNTQNTNEASFTFLFQKRAVPIRKTSVAALAKQYSFVTHPEP